MGRLSARSNPTGLKELDRRCVGISLRETGGRRSFVLDRLDGEGLDGALRVIVVARAGNTQVRHEMGTLAAQDREPKWIDALDRSQSLRFRILMHEPGTARLSASIENVRPRDDSQSESLLPMESADLGERLWRLAFMDDGPVLQFNSKVFPSAAGAENYLPFGAMVLPEALRQVVARIAEEPGCLDDEAEAWQVWATWLDDLGVGRPPVDGDERESADWCDLVIDRFCQRFGFASALQAELERGNRNV